MGKNARIRSLRAEVRAGRDDITEDLAPHLRLRPRTLRRIAATPVPRTPGGRPMSNWTGKPARWFAPEPPPVPRVAQAYARAEKRREAKRQARARRGATIIDDSVLG